MQTVKMLTYPEHRAPLTVLQEQNFPLPETWDTAPTLVRFLEEIAA